MNINPETIAEALNDPHFSFIETFADASDSSKVTREMTRLLFTHRRMRTQLQKRERERTMILREYNKKKRESYISHKAAPNERTKSILVEIDTEEEKFQLDVIEQKIKELTRGMASIKLEIDTWKAISYNLRTEMGSY